MLSPIAGVNSVAFRWRGRRTLLSRERKATLGRELVQIVSSHNSAVTAVQFGRWIPVLDQTQIRLLETFANRRLITFAHQRCGN